MPSVKFEKLKPQIVLGVAAHPDDLDFGAAGTVAKWAKQGSEVYYLILTDGSKGSADRNISASELIKIRRAEQRAAAEILGVKKVFFCDYEDGCLECCEAVKVDITRCIRKIKPDVVVTMDPTMVYVAETGFVNHPDHRAAGQSTLDAVFPLARDHLSYPELIKEGLEPHISPTLMLINFERQNWFEDVSSTINTKMKALAAHQSQMPSMEATKKLMRNLAENEGKKCNCDYAEGFMRIDVK